MMVCVQAEQDAPLHTAGERERLRKLLCQVTIESNCFLIEKFVLFLLKVSTV